jgi:chloramphenicol O-acetyltransferase type A
MRYVDMDTWPRREHFEVFRTWGYPHFNLCANVDLTTFFPAVEEQGSSISIAIVYILARAANEIPEFRYRIRGDTVLEHEVVHPSTTILTKDDLFTFCPLEYTQNFKQFAAGAEKQFNYVRDHPTMEGPQDDAALYMTAIPWVSFTSFLHPFDLDNLDSVPRFAWGKFFEEGDKLRMPLNVQAHHAVMDGIHMGRWYEKVQDYFSQPDILLTDY